MVWSALAMAAPIMRWAREFEVAVGRTVPRGAFDPPPRVPSAVLHVHRRRHRG
ncbi:MAG: hypothetical protein JJU45_00990 [Acidimicrobiia bacterium]|nr:hypothetical protein [Acidimicrobiia bacterium]